VAKRVSLKGKGADLFFGDYAPEPPPVERSEPNIGDSDDPLAVDKVMDAGSTVKNGAEPADGPATTPAPPRASTEPHAPPARAQARSHASKQASINIKNEGANAVEAIRKTVKTLGREVSFVRLTPEEKGALAEVVYAYKRQGIKTTENEINRIAINALLADYHARGEASLLARVLAALRA
jgi:hypothetical protein